MDLYNEYFGRLNEDLREAERMEAARLWWKNRKQQEERREEEARSGNPAQKVFDSIKRQLDEIEADYKKFNGDWDQEGRSSCYTYHVLMEHIKNARDLAARGRLMTAGFRI